MVPSYCSFFSSLSVSNAVFFMFICLAATFFLSSPIYFSHCLFPCTKWHLKILLSLYSKYTLFFSLIIHSLLLSLRSLSFRSSSLRAFLSILLIALFHFLYIALPSVFFGPLLFSILLNESLVCVHSFFLSPLWFFLIPCLFRCAGWHLSGFFFSSYSLLYSPVFFFMSSCIPSPSVT